MMKHTLLIALISLCSYCVAQTGNHEIDKDDVSRILKTLSSDEMGGRKVFSTGIEKAAEFIDAEFRKIGLSPLPGQTGFKQAFQVTRITPGKPAAIIDGVEKDERDVLVLTGRHRAEYTQENTRVAEIQATDNFMAEYQKHMQSAGQVIVFVDPSHSDIFKRLKGHYSGTRIMGNAAQPQDVIFIVGARTMKFKIGVTNKIEQLPLTNIVGTLPGKSKEKELVVFSAHYDHIGIQESVAGDSIANGADDDASGTTAVISLARHFKETADNERTLIFVAFTAEESGGFGSKYFSEALNPDDVTAMFNIEMIGKESKFGKNAAFITGFERSDFGQILQQNLKGTAFTFHPDPYPDQNLFYRSDNATLAALGVPAHTISTDQIDIDKYYHTVDDEFETLDLENVTATIRAIALSARSIISGKDTPRRIPKLNQK